MVKDGLYVQLISIHGLVRSQNMELGRDADTGGQIKYVVELAKALAEHPDVGRVDLLTRQIIDSKVDADYAAEEEVITSGANIIRLPCGPKRYLRKEVLWPHIDSFVDQALKHIRRIGRVPDFVHSHYADAGLVGAKLASLLEVPLIHTGHSLGRVKQQRLIDQGLTKEVIESEYRINTRIDAEEIALDNAAFIVASTQQEVRDQYSQYDNYHPQRMVVIPPGVDIDRFYPPRAGWFKPKIFEELDRFLSEPRKPMIMAMSRPDHRKNIATLVRAYGESEELQALANIIIIAGNRDDTKMMEKGPREVLAELLYLFDKYDLYGKAAYPKHHEAEDVPFLYRLAAKSRGVFVNPALTEPFGLTLIEAAASGLPVVATEDGGPQDIISHCKNGVLIDPLDKEAMTSALLALLKDREKWQRYAKAGVKGAHRHFSWSGHVQRYLKEVKKVLRKSTKRSIAKRRTRRLPMSDRALVCDVDNTLIGNTASLRKLLSQLKNNDEHIGFGIATGRYLESTLKTLKEWNIKAPDFFITSVGSEIYYSGSRLIADTAWAKHINYRWQPQDVRRVMRQFKGVKLQARDEQRAFKISYFYDPRKALPVRKIIRQLRQADLHVNVVYSHGMYLDILPIRASKGLAVRYLASKWGFPPERILVAGDAGSDEDMLSGETLGIVVGNYSSELEKLRGRERIYFADKECAAGILEGMEHYDFFGVMQSPDESGEAQ
jgi:sucrose-phosphate synthase